MVKMENSCLQRRGIEVSDIHLSCATRGHSNCPKVGPTFLAEVFFDNTYATMLSNEKSDYVFCPCHLAQTSAGHGISVLNYEIQRLG
jgi:hypothetical protein